jgi:hypothetical protein
MQHNRIHPIPSPRELTAAVVQAPEHLRPLVANFGAKLGADDHQATADGLFALRAALVAAHRLTIHDRPLARLEERTVAAYLNCGPVDLVVVPIPVGPMEVHDTAMLVTPHDPDAHQPWRFLLSGTRLLAVEPPENLTA